MNIDLSLENAGRGVLESGVTTFAQVFARGELSGGSGLVANLGGRTSAVQLDVKTTYDDGSVKMAVLSLLRPDLAAGQSVDVALSTAAASAVPAIDLARAIGSHSFEIDIVGQGGKHEVDVLGALREALANGTASTWQNGALASQARVEVPLDGSQRLVFDVTVYAGGGMKVDAQFNNDGAMGADGGRVSYHVTATMDGEVVMRQSVNQDQYQNWHESFSTTDHDGGQGLGSPAKGWLNIGHDAAHLENTGAIADYNLSIGVSEARLSAWGAAAQSNGFGDPLSANDLVQYMPTTGGRDDIGFTTAANTAWLMTQDPRAAAYALGQAEAASAIPWHLWDSANDEWLSADAYPHLWTDGRGGTGTPGNANSGGLTQQIGTGSGWTLDSAHQPDVSYVPYLLTGERWMLDSLQARLPGTSSTPGPTRVAQKARWWSMVARCGTPPGHCDRSTRRPGPARTAARKSRISPRRPRRTGPGWWSRSPPGPQRRARSMAGCRATTAPSVRCRPGSRTTSPPPPSPLHRRATRMR